ncbi:MAG: hydrogenase nickel incorporation protein HypB [SAR324 cluster bacterium]|nr:hydrogenase nickel incorporation protein HypB [SAR324 cluster bacterium]
MCQDCGCLETEHVTVGQSPFRVISQKTMVHTHQEHLRPDQGNTTKKISIKQEVLQKNNHIAAHNREHFIAQRIFCLNWISAPGSGKTSILEKMIRDLNSEFPMAVIEGDQQTDRDAQRISNAGAPVVQINTGAACHLDAEMIHQAWHQLQQPSIRWLMIENVGNMVCPTAYDLGEAMKIAVISCPEGEDKPVKYPDLLLTAKVLLINKIDLLPYLDFDLQACISFSRKVNPEMMIFPVSAKTGEGFNDFYNWLRRTHVSGHTHESA